MKIVHKESGKAYQLNPGTKLQIERTNLFFNDYGEQSYPIDLPDTPLNRELCGHPEDLANRNKPLQDIDCVISDGAYYMPCRQAILSAKQDEKISTSFYMNEGSFLARITKTPLRDIFGDETIPDVNTVEDGIAFCESLMDNQNENYSICPIIMNVDGEKRIVNRIHLMDSEGKIVVGRAEVNSGKYNYHLYNKWARVETIDTQRVDLAPGYYITPLMRAMYLLKRLFEYFGYKLLDNFFAQTEPFNKMVVFNNTCDSLVTGQIYLCDLVPDCYCSDLLEVFRKKFCCEFIPDEIKKTVSIEFFEDIINSNERAMIDHYVFGHGEIEYEEPRQLKLFSKQVLDDMADFDGEFEIKSKYPTAYIQEWNASTFYYSRDGYTNGKPIQRIASMNIPYYAGESDKEDYEVEVPDTIWGIDSLEIKATYGKVTQTWNYYCAYIGDGAMLNSKLVVGNTSEEETTASDSDDERHDGIISLACIVIDNYPKAAMRTSADSYTLTYNGMKGLYATFWKKFDMLLRNAMHTVTVPLMLSNELKQGLSVTHKVSMHNQDYLFNKLTYTIGGDDEPIDTELLTLNVQEPINVGPTSEDIFGAKTTCWQVHATKTALTEAEWVAAGYEPQVETKIPAIYPHDPTPEQVESGGEYYKRTVYSTLRHTNSDDSSVSWAYYKWDIYLTPAYVTTE